MPAALSQEQILRRCETEGLTTNVYRLIRQRLGGFTPVTIPKPTKQEIIDVLKKHDICRSQPAWVHNHDKQLIITHRLDECATALRAEDIRFLCNVDHILIV